MKESDRMEKKPIARLKNVTKSIKGKTIINNLSLDLFPGEVTGFLGPNGAGKTTTIRMMVGLMKPTSGDIIIGDFPLDKQYEKAIRQVGAIVENPEMYPFLSGYDNLLHFARMHGPVSKQRIDEVVKQVGMEARIHDKVKSYSLGMKQRLGLAQALIHKPKLLILDEPTNGLDPAGMRSLRLYLRKLAAEEGVSIFVSSHLLSEIEMMCDRIAVIQQGKLVDIQSVHEKNQQEMKTFLFKLSDQQAAMALVQQKYEGTEMDTDENYLHIHLHKDQVPEINRLFVENGIDVFEIVPLRKSLEDQFLEMTGGEQIV